MKTTTKFAFSMVVLLVAVATIASQFLKVRLVETQISKYTTNAGELVRDVLVGQTFVAQKDNLSGVAVMFATYSNRSNTAPVKFHLWQNLDAKENLRTVSVSASELGDNQLHRFEFDPIPDSKGRTYFFFLVSPNSAPGNAVTVDLNTQDPYFLGSAFIVRDQGSAVTDPTVLSAAGKPTIDVVFETYHTVTAREAVWTKAVGYARTFVGTWDEKRGTYWLWFRLALPAGLFLVCVGLIRRLSWSLAVWLPVLLLAAFFMRLWYAMELPLTTDEGNYLYDAWTLLHGKLAGGDGYVKAPLVVAWVAAWQFIFGNTILAGRLSSIVMGVLTLLSLYSLGRNLFDKKTGLTVTAAWAFFGPAVVFNIYVHTQPVALFLGVSGLAVLLMALKGTTPRASLFAPKAPAADWWFALSGVLLGLAVASRKSMLALGLIPILFILMYGRSWRLRITHVATVGIAFLVVLGLFLGFAWLTYGGEGIWEALGANSAEDGINVAEEDAELIRVYSIRGMTPFFRESLALIWFAVLGFGIACERAVRAGIEWLLRLPPVAKAMGGKLYGAPKFLFDYAVPKLAWVPALILFASAWSFFNEYEGEAFHILGIPTLWWVMGLGLLMVALMPRMQEDALHLPDLPEVVQKSTQPTLRLSGATAGAAQPRKPDFLPKLAAALIGPLWILGLVVFYTNWIKFHANYIAEFIPPLVLLAAPGVAHLFDRLRAPLFLSSDYPPIAVLRKLVVAGVMLVMFWALYTSSYITFLFEHTGTFAQGSVNEAAQWAREHIPPNEPVFTGAALVPYVSGHAVSLDIAHPRWYAYEFTRKDTQRINTFLPPAEEMVQAFRDAKWVLHEAQTQFSFFVEYADLEQGLPRDFVKVHEVENGSNPLIFYQRVR